MKKHPIDRIARQYYQMSLWLTTVISLVVLVVMNIAWDMSLINGLLISVCFTFASSVAYGAAWKSVAKSSPTNLAKFYLAATAIRMLAALAVATVGIILLDKSEAIGFAVIFIIFYLSILVFDTIYFSRVEKKGLAKLQSSD
jgi:F0F1-type ATP synthase assembly protein I